MGLLAVKIIIALIGFALCAFYGTLGIAAIINLPASWFGVLYCLFGITSGVLCFVYYFKQKNIFFILIIPAVIFMLLTLVVP